MKREQEIYNKTLIDYGFWTGVIATLKLIQSHSGISYSASLLDAQNNLQRIKDKVARYEEAESKNDSKKD